mgnify:CR=1 FL=1
MVRLRFYNVTKKGTSLIASSPMNNKVVSSKLSEMKIGNFVFLFLAKSVFGNVIKYKGSIASVAPTKFATASKHPAERLESNNYL